MEEIFCLLKQRELGTQEKALSSKTAATLRCLPDALRKTATGGRVILSMDECLRPTELLQEEH